MYYGTETVIYSECIASARWSCLAGVALIRPGLRYDGIKVLNVLRVQPISAIDGLRTAV